jgi:hypothetical protein
MMDYLYGYQDPAWLQIANRGIDVLGARYGQGQYTSPDNPMYRQGGGGMVATGPALTPGAVSGQGFQINWWAAALGGVLIGAFLLGRKGR